MTEQMKAFLEAAQIDISSLQQLKTGASGACVWKCTRKGQRCVAKYTEKAAVSEAVWQGSLREVELLAAMKGVDFLPEALFVRRNDDAVLIIEPEYRPIAAHEWTDALLADAMALCARVHAADAAQFADIFDRKEAQADGWDLRVSLDGWLRLAEKFPCSMDRALLERIYADFTAIPARVQALDLPQGLAHGDCHPENFLLEGGKMRLCDWQGAHIGCGVGDVSFFFSRGADMGVKIDENALIEAYLAALAREGISLSRQAFDKCCAASTLTVSFQFWAMYLQDAPEARVAEIYRPMAAAYEALFEQG